MRGDEHGGVPHIMLARRNAVLKVDLPEAARAFARRWAVVEQRREYGIAINARHAGPDEPPGAVDQRGYLAIADRPKLARRGHAKDMATQSPKIGTTAGREN